MRRLDEGIADLRLTQVLYVVSRCVVDKCRPSTEPSVEAGIAGSFLQLLELCSHENGSTTVYDQAFDVFDDEEQIQTAYDHEGLV